MQTLGNFEQLAQAYQAGRRGFDGSVFDFLAQQGSGLEGKKILDIGCGTGIATRQLAQSGAEVTGCDVSPGMIVEARQGGEGIEYLVAPTHRLPFGNASFDIATAFSAFHWFTDSDSVKEIKRVLKDDGLFAVINKNDTAGIRKDVSELFNEYRGAESAKHKYDPEKILRTSGFKKVVAHKVSSTEVFTPKQALIYLQSIALWNLVPEDKKEEMLVKVESFCDNVLKQKGVLKRELETVVVVGFKG